MNRDRIIWAAWWIGTVLIVLSWVKVVPIAIGWIGFAIACVSSIVSVIIRKYWLPPNAQRHHHATSEHDSEGEKHS